MGDDETPRPSKASMREVKREYKARRKAEAEEQARREQAVRDYWSLETGRATAAPASSRPRRGGAVAVGALVLAVGFAGFVGYRAITASSSSTAASGSSAAPSSSAPTGARPSGSPAASASPGASQDDGTDPTVVPAFDGSPAKDWPRGAAGITTPKAKQVGIYRPAQVQAAYDRVADYLRAALLDPRVTYKGKLDPVLATLGSASSTYLRKQHAKAVSTKGRKGTYWPVVANRFRPGEWRAAAEVRVKGRMKPSIGQRGTLAITFTYVSAYWLVPAKGGEPRTIAVRRSGTMQFFGVGSSRVSPPGYSGSGYTTSASVCGSNWPYPDYLQAWADPEDVAVASPSAPAGSFDITDVDADEPDECFTDTSGF